MPPGSMVLGLGRGSNLTSSLLLLGIKYVEMMRKSAATIIINYITLWSGVFVLGQDFNDYIGYDGKI